MISPSSLRNKAIFALGVVTLVVLALSAHVNAFMGFFYVADRFPFVMSVLTLAVLAVIVVLHHVHAGNVRMARPKVELPSLAVLVIVWTGCNSFATSRWQGIQPAVCAAIDVESNPAFLRPAKVWCQEILALRAFVWIEWLLLLTAFCSLLTYCIVQTKRGSDHVWATPLSIYDPLMAPPSQWKAGRGVFGKYATEKRRASTSYPFDMHTGTNYSSFGRHTASLTTHTRESGTGSALGYQLDPFNVSKDRRVSTPSLAPDDNQFMPTTWQTFTDHTPTHPRIQPQQYSPYGAAFGQSDRYPVQTYAY